MTTKDTKCTKEGIAADERGLRSAMRRHCDPERELFFGGFEKGWWVQPTLLVAQSWGEAVGADVVVAVESGEAADGGGNADGGEAGMAGGGVGAAVIHGGADGDAGGHF